MVKKVILPVVAVIIIVVVIVSLQGDRPTPPQPPESRTTGPWVDAIVVRQESSTPAAVRKLEAGDIDIWLSALTDPDLYERVVTHPDIRYEFSYGAFTELTFNVAGPYFYDGRMNPFYDAGIREAFNWLIDRDYMIGSLLRGMGTPIYALAGRVFPEYGRHQDVFEAIEEYYAHDPENAETARGIVHDRMVTLGAELIGGAWHYQGDEVEIRFVIVTDWFPPLYPAGGEYIADLMEWVGFTVNRIRLPGSAAVSYLVLDDPFDGTYNSFTGGWAFAAIPRDEGQRFYASDTKFVRPWPRWQTLDAPEDYLEVARALYQRDYSTLTEREELFEQ
ncbi:MAG: ABC transporter substrate-binding protein, partial [Dehalococcoidia bacterium]